MVSSEIAASNILQSNQIQQVFKGGFNIASELIFVFQTTNKITTTKTQQVQESQPHMDSLDDEFYFFEVYEINSRHIVGSLNDGVVDFHCRFCRGPAIRRSNLYGLTINISAMVKITC